MRTTVRRGVAAAMLTAAMLGLSGCETSGAARSTPANAGAGKPVHELASPDGKVRLTLRQDASRRLRYDVTFAGKPILLASTLGIIVDGNDLGTSARVGAVTSLEIDEQYPIQGAHTTATNRCREVTIAMTGGAKRTPWFLDLRAYDDGVAYRYRVPGDVGATRHVDGEASEWVVPADAKITFQPHFPRKDYEGIYQTGAFNDLPRLLTPRPTTRRATTASTTTTTASTTRTAPATTRAAATTPASTQPFKPYLAAPALLHLPNGGGYALLTEANLIDYTDLALEYVGRDRLRAYFHNMPGGWDWQGEIVSPWRAAVVTDDLNTLVNSDLVRNLCPPPPPELANADWIKPGRATWHWMVSGRPRLPDQQRWVDWTQALDFEYYLIDDGWNRWRDGDKDPWACMKDVVDYANARDVKIWAWVDSKDIRDHPTRDAYFAKARQTGIVGIKIDFIPPADVAWVRWYDDVLADAARHRLLVNFHGSLRPTGRERTWPHNLTRESIRGRENRKQPMTHDGAVPFVRYVQGAADYTPTDFRPERLMGSSWAHELSMAVIYTTPFLCYGGSPESYLGNESVELLKSIPAIWDETIVLPGTVIGERVAFARRKDDTWFVAAMTGPDVPDFRIDLTFLGEGRYQIEKFGDSPEKPDAWTRDSGQVTKGDSLTVPMRKDGGFVARLRPVR